MAKVGYIFKANSYDALDADKEWMRQYGCVQVVEEECAHEALRPQWKQLMASLGRGDELVVAKFSNAVRDLRGLAALVELCRIKVVRLVSIHDKIDTLGELFPDTTAAQVLEMFGALPEEVAVLRKSSSHIMQLQQTIKPPVTKKAMSRAEREKTIVDMYNNGYSIDDIWEVSGFNSKRQNQRPACQKATGRDKITDRRHTGENRRERHPVLLFRRFCISLYGV